MLFRQFFLFISLAWYIQCCGDENSIKEYLRIYERYPNLIQSVGDFSQGEIQVVTDPDVMASIEKMTSREVGVLKQDRYWIWVNDACIFANGKQGVYGRILWQKSLEGIPGVAVMAVTDDGKIGLNCNFRHATRSWEIELPRGGVNLGEDIESAARREVAEETGMKVAELVLLGEMTPDTGISNSVIPIYMAKVESLHAAECDDSEAIEQIIFLTVPEIKKAFLQGFYELCLRGQVKHIPFRDPFLAYAILMYELKNECR